MLKELALLGYFTSEIGYTQAQRYVETPVRFEMGEPVCQLVPQRRGELDAFVPEMRDIAAALALRVADETWLTGRAAPWRRAMVWKASFVWRAGCLPCQGSQA